MTTDALKHKERTLQDILDEMTSDEKELQDLIIGAAVEDEDLSGNPEIVEQYDKLSLEKKYLINFVVGNVITDNLNHSYMEVDNFLSHFGVKGMKWGVRNPRATGQARLSTQAKNNYYVRRELRDKVKGGSATLGEAHQAALKSTGHRAFNAFVGDKTYWKGTAIAAGIAGAAVGASFAAPMVLPAGVLMSVGASAMGTTAAGVASNAALTSAGAAAITSTGLSATYIGSTIASGVLQVKNITRAVRGNTRIDKSYAALGKTVNDRQTAGTKKVQKMLNKSGSLGKRSLKQSDLRVGNFLAHYATTPVKLVEKEL